MSARVRLHPCQRRPHYDEPCDCETRLAMVVTHTRTSTGGFGPDFCAECSQAIGEWVPWPCEARATQSSDDLADERADIIARFTAELAKVTGDGSRKRQAGTKPPWYEDDSHEGAVFSHITKWKRGELVDPDSGCHPLVHAGWRLIAIALKETGNIPNSE